MTIWNYKNRRTNISLKKHSIIVPKITKFMKQGKRNLVWINNELGKCSTSWWSGIRYILRIHLQSCCDWCITKLGTKYFVSIYFLHWVYFGAMFQLLPHWWNYIIRTLERMKNKNSIGIDKLSVVTITHELYIIIILLYYFIFSINP